MKVVVDQKISKDVYMTNMRKIHKHRNKNYTKIEGQKSAEVHTKRYKDTT